MKSWLRKYWLLACLGAVIPIGVAIVLLRPRFPQEADVVIQRLVILLGWILFLVQYLYSKWDSFYIRLNNIRFWLTNETTKWNLKIEFKGIEKPQPLEVALNCVSQTENLKAVIWHSDSNKKIVNMPGYTLRFRTVPNPVHVYSGMDDEQILELELSNLELPYNRCRPKLSREIIPLIDKIAKALAPQTEKYAVKIGFRSVNPYFGFFVRRLNLPQVVSFNCDLLERTVGGQEQVVSVRKDKIEIVTDNLHALQTLSLKYIAFSLENI